jgi:hypothetical protein
MDRDQLHNRLMILKQEIKAGRIKFTPDLQVVEALAKVAYAPDGKVEPQTVDASVRALANAVSYMRYRDELKRIPLIDVQRAYFDILNRFFGHPFSEMKRHKVSPHDIARGMASTDSLVKAFASEADEFATGVKEFWQLYGPVVYAHLEDLHALKCVYGGDMFPSYTANIACSVGLYVDTIVLPDPLLRAATFFRGMKPEALVYYTAKHALNALSYRELALADVEPPIVVIAPDNVAIDESMPEYLRSTGMADLLLHCGRLFDRTFSSAQTLDTFLSRLSRSDQLLARLADPTRLLFDVDWSGPLEDQIRRYTEETLTNFGPAIDPSHVGQVIWFCLLGRMMQINDLLFKSSQFRATPVIDAPTSWQYLLWKLEYDQQRAKQLLPEAHDVLLCKALQAQGSEELELISGMPPQVLIDLRREGALAQLRDTLRRGMDDIDLATPSALADVVDMVMANVSAAFSNHKQELAVLSASRRRFFGLEVAPWITVGGISVAAAAAGNIPLSVLAASLGMLGVPSAKELWKEGKALVSKGDELKRSPAGILFRHIGRKRRKGSR